MSQIEKCHKIKNVSSWKWKDKKCHKRKKISQIKMSQSRKKCHQLKNVLEFKMSPKNVSKSTTKQTTFNVKRKFSIWLERKPLKTIVLRNPHILLLQPNVVFHLLSRTSMTSNFNNQTDNINGNHIR